MKVSKTFALNGVRVRVSVEALGSHSVSDIAHGSSKSGDLVQLQMGIFITHRVYILMCTTCISYLLFGGNYEGTGFLQFKW
jgi:hypothetical protein